MADHNHPFDDEELGILEVALYEYIAHRSDASSLDPREYVDRRYPADKYPEDFRQEKLVDVRGKLVKARGTKAKFSMGINFRKWKNGVPQDVA